MNNGQRIELATVSCSNETIWVPQPAGAVCVAPLTVPGLRGTVVGLSSIIDGVLYTPVLLDGDTVQTEIPRNLLEPYSEPLPRVSFVQFDFQDLKFHRPGDDR